MSPYRRVTIACTGDDVAVSRRIGSADDATGIASPLYPTARKTYNSRPSAACAASGTEQNQCMR